MGKTKKSFKNNIYIYGIIGNLFIDRTVWLSYLQHLGYEISAIGIMQGMLTLSMFIFEMPSGIIADRFSPKITIILGHILIALYLIAMLLQMGFFVTTIGFILYGAGLAMISGSDQTIIHSVDKHKSYIYKIGIFNALCIISIGLSSFVGGLLTNFSWETVYILEIFFQICCIIYIYFFKVADNESSNEVNNFLNMFSNFKEIIQSKKIVYLILAFSVYDATLSTLFNFSQALFNFNNLNPFLTSTVLSVAYIFSSAAGFSINRIVKMLSRERTILLFLIISIIIYFIFLVPLLSILIILYFLSNYVFEIVNTSLNATIHKETNDRIRTTTISFANTITAFIMFLESILFGFLFDLFNITLVYSVIGILSSAVVALLFSSYKRLNCN
jgi:MFS family permease